MNLAQLAYASLFGKPLIFYFGILTLTLLFSTATIGYLSYKGKNVPFKLHIYLAGTTLVVSVLHALLGIASNI